MLFNIGNATRGPVLQEHWTVASGENLFQTRYCRGADRGDFNLLFCFCSCLKHIFFNTTAPTARINCALLEIEHTMLLLFPNFFCYILFCYFPHFSTIFAGAGK
jgi:hypothetical protein